MQAPPSLPYLFVCFLNIGSPSVHFLSDNLPRSHFILCSVVIVDTDRNALPWAEGVRKAGPEPARRGARRASARSWVSSSRLPAKGTSSEERRGPHSHFQCSLPQVRWGCQSVPNSQHMFYLNRFSRWSHYWVGRTPFSVAATFCPGDGGRRGGGRTCAGADHLTDTLRGSKTCCHFFLELLSIFQVEALTHFSL